jgi:hypothetical protein
MIRGPAPRHTDKPVRRAQPPFPAKGHCGLDTDAGRVTENGLPVSLVLFRKNLPTGHRDDGGLVTLFGKRLARLNGKPDFGSCGQKRDFARPVGLMQNIGRYCRKLSTF